VTAAEHTLVLDGWPHVESGGIRAPRPRSEGAFRGPSADAAGCALCSCLWLSEPLPTTEARRQAHTQHVTEETP